MKLAHLHLHLHLMKPSGNLKSCGRDDQTTCGQILAAPTEAISR